MNIIERIKKAILKSINWLGYTVLKIQVSDNPLYELIVTGATYAPWNQDNNFIRTYNLVNKHTLVDKYRCYELWDLVNKVRKIPGDLIEVGVWRGGSGALIAKSAELSGIKDKVYLCDTFSGVPKASEKDETYKGGEHDDTTKETVEYLVNNLELSNVIILQGIFPDETGFQIENQQFRFCHIDVDVYESAKGIVEWIWKRLGIGGVIVFDDYGIESTNGITTYVNEMAATFDCLMIYNLNGHAVIIKSGY
jgi:O-methyltransferase